MTNRTLLADCDEYVYAVGPAINWNESSIVKSQTKWLAAGRVGFGMCEYHDLMIEGLPVGIDD